MPTFSKARAGAVMLAIAVLMSALVGRVAYLQTYGRERTIRSADRQHMDNSVWYARRGTIFDTRGNLMAGTVQTQTLFIDPKFMQESFQSEGRSLVEMDDAVAKLAHLIDKDPFTVSQLISDRSTSRYVKVAENLDEQLCEQIEKMNIPGVGFTPTNDRYYPMGSLAAHLLGGTGTGGQGLEGLELKFNQLLAGRNGFKRTLKDARRRPIAVAAEDYVPPQHGEHLILTIDANIQMMAEQELAATCEKFQAKRGEVVVMDPRTGNVLALANWPTFNPQNLQDSTPEVRRDRAITDPFEPGSIFKPFIAGPAIMWGQTRPAEVFPVHGPVYRTPYGRRVTDVHAYDQLSLWDVLVKSSNIGMSMLGERLGNAKLRAAITSFGFGRPTGIELPGEDGGRINPLDRWTKYSTESVSQGYEVMVTPLQLARAFCAYGNGGHLVQPHIVKGVMDSDGQILQRTTPVSLVNLQQPVDAETAASIRRILCDVVIRGTATGARSKFYNIVGKSGTAHISEGKSGYSLTKFNSSFLAGAPYEHPRLIVAFIVHEPVRKLGHYGGTVSGPGAQRLIDRALTYLQVPPSGDLPLPAPQMASVIYDYRPQLYAKPVDHRSGGRHRAPRITVSAAE
jgi:cell division protein FtsI (penicillin-binding protein 3)